VRSGIGLDLGVVLSDSLLHGHWSKRCCLRGLGLIPPDSRIHRLFISYGPKVFGEEDT
jgi:hypothetical protein